MALVVSTKTPPKPVPHDEGCAFVFRCLSKRELREAEEANTQHAFDAIASLRASMPPEEWEKNQQAAALQRIEHPTETDPRDLLDKDVLLKYGIVSWAGPGYDGVPITDPAGQLDPQTYDWAVEVILSMNVRPLGEG